MTCCIAALCEGGKTAVLIADRRVGMSFVEADIALKISWIGKNWPVLIAGDDLSAGFEVTRTAANYMKGKWNATNLNDAHESLVKAYQQVRLGRAETKFLKSRGWTLEQFREKGHALLPQLKFVEIDSAIEKFELGVELLACGFSTTDNTADLFSVKELGEASLESAHGFDAIGSGSISALTSLFRRGYNKFMTLPQALYYAYEAKVAAEYASGVSARTMIVMLRKGAEAVVISQSEQEPLRAIVESLKPGNLLDAHVAVISGISTVQKFLQPPPPPAAIPAPPPHG